MKINKDSALVSSLGHVLVVDDEPALVNVLCKILSSKGYMTTGLNTGREALEAVNKQYYDLILTDLKMPGMDGITLIRKAREIDPNLVAIVMTGHGTVESAVEAMRVGAFEYVIKPFKFNMILPVLARAMEMRQLRMENIQLRETLAIYELSMTAAFALDQNIILNKMADAAMQGFKADELSIMLPSKDGRELTVVMIRGKNREHIHGYSMPIHQGIAGWVAKQRKAVRLQGEVNDRPFVPIQPRSEISSSISIPMMIGGKVMGVLNVNAIHRRPFTPGEGRALNILVNIAASALETTRLYEEVKRAETKYRSIFENTVEGIFQTTSEGVFLDANPAMAKILGYESPEELISSTTDITRQYYVNPEERSDFMRRMEEQGFVGVFEFQVYRKDGSMIWISEKVRAIKDKKGNVLFHEGICEDITGRKIAEEALKSEKEKFQVLVEESPLGISLIGEEGDYKYLNPRFTEIFGYTAEDLPTSREWFEKAYPDPEYRKKVLSIWMNNHGDGNEKKPRKGIFTARCKNGFEKVIQFIPVKLTTGDQLVIYEDITEHKKLESQLLQSQKMEAIGRLAGGLAHDLNNMLTTVIGFADLTSMNLEKKSPLKANLDEIKKAADHATTLTRQLLTFSRKQVVQPVVLDLNTVIEETQKMLRRLIGEDIELVTILEPDLGKVKTDPGQIEQVIMNLAVNARDAMPLGGKLTIETGNLYLDESYVREHDQDLKRGFYVRLSVSDTGCGMSEKIQSHIFEPFFTTKEKGKGTGLGLSTVYGIVKQSGGHIWCYSEQGKGTTFKIYLPMAEQKQETLEKKQDQMGDVKASETILVVEDNHSVRSLAVRILREQGYKILEAKNGEEALKIHKEYGEALHLILTDIVMPGISGITLTKKLAHWHPDIKVLYMSGYTDNAIVHHGILSGQESYIQKPFSPKDLVRQIRNVLDS